MRAAVYPESGDPSDIRIEEFDDPSPGPTEAVVRVEACALNHRDLWKLEGVRETVDGAFVGGADVAGVVEATGADVASVAPGDRVLLFPLSTCGTCRFCREGPENLCENYDSFDGGFAERCVVSAERLVALPDDVAFDDAASLPVAYVTAWRMYDRADVAAGDTVLVPGATGGLGLAAVQLAAIRGVTVVGTTRSAGKAESLAAAGADHVVRTDDPDELVAEVGEIGEMDAVLNHLGGEFVEAGLSTLRRNGTMVVCGRTAGGRAEIDLWDVYWYQRRLLGSTLGTQPNLERLVGFVDDGELDPVVDATYPLADVGRAFERMRDGDAFGKLLVRPSA